MTIKTGIGAFLMGGSALVVGQMSTVADTVETSAASFTCAAATPASMGDNAFDSSNATVTLTVPGGGSCTAHSMYKTVYWTFTPAETSNHTFTTCGLATWDTRITILNTCSTGDGVVACNDDACNFQSSVVASLTAGTTYRVVLGGYGTADGGAGSLNIAIGGSGGGGGGGGGGACGTGTATDVIVGAIPDVTKYGGSTVNGISYMAYAFGTTSCNIGTCQLEWFSSPDNRHPFIPMNMYRLRNGRFEQIGIGWGKHGFTALQQSLCGTCQSSGTGTYLGIGCSDPYSSGLNGSQSGLGTRSEVNASTGIFPGTINQGMPAAPATYGRRCIAKADDLNPALNAGATYFAEGHYIHPQDAAYGTDDNNASYRGFTVGALSSGAYTLTLTGSTIQQKAAIEAWRAADAGVQLEYADVAGDGRFIVGCKATQNANGTWRYEYAVHNLNSDRSGRSFTVPIPAGVTVTNAGFKDIDYHSGDPYSGTDWTIAVNSGNVTWTGGTHSVSPNGNALRFATLYNFWFDATSGPSDQRGAIGLFKPGAAGAPNSVEVALKAPAPTGNPADLNGDGAVTGADLGLLLSNWGNAGQGDLNGDGSVNGADLGLLLSAWG